MSCNIKVEGGKSVRLLTAGKYCDRDILVTAEGVDLPELATPGTSDDLMAGKQMIDGDGNVLVPCEMDEVYGISNGFATVEKDGKFGVITTRSLYIEPIYDEVEENDGLLKACKDGMWGYIGSKSSNGTNLVDSWGGTVYYRYPGAFNKTGFDLIAPGPDGNFGTVANTSAPADATVYKDSGEWACDDISNFMDK